MEFLLVVYDDAERDVLIAGGNANHLITLAPGTYTISLDGPSDFKPAEQDVLVIGSSPLRPKKVRFV